MYNDQTIIKKNFHTQIQAKFGDVIHHDLVTLIDQLQDVDTYITNNLYLNLQNLLALTPHEVVFFIQLATELAAVSLFAPVLLLEKIPTLSFYGVTEAIGEFLRNIKHYGSRAISLFLGSDLLKTEDLLDVLEQSSRPFYTALLQRVNLRHTEFGVCSAMLMRCCASIETWITQENIDYFLDQCAMITAQYPTKITENYIKNAHHVRRYVPLEETTSIFDELSKKSLFILEFAVSHPALFFAHAPYEYQTPTSPTACLKALKIKILETEAYIDAFREPRIHQDPNFMSILIAWPTLATPLRHNILFQLKQDHYKTYIEQSALIAPAREAVNDATQSHWLTPWMYAGGVVDATFIRQRMGVHLQNPQEFSLPIKSIIKQHATLFDRKNSVYDNERLSNMIQVLLEYHVQSPWMNELMAMRLFLQGDTKPLRDHLSQSDLVIQTWDRDPWTDYGRSDELFSCTSLGDYNAGNAPAFLADLNLNHLDLWRHGQRIGRIHLCLVQQNSKNPLLLLDCVDGTERMLGTRKKFDLILQGIFDYARFLGIHQLKINYDVDYNTTPKKFIAHAQRRFNQETSIDYFSRFLNISTTRHLMPYPCQTFTESFIKNNGAFIRGPWLTLTQD